MRPWAQPCKNNGPANLFMILAVFLSVFSLKPANVLFSRLVNVAEDCTSLLEHTVPSSSNKNQRIYQTSLVIVSMAFCDTYDDP